MNAIFYVLRGGIMWRRLPNDFPPRPTACRWFARLRDKPNLIGKMEGIARDSAKVVSTPKHDKGSNELL